MDTYVTLYGAKGCSKTVKTEEHLRRIGVPYHYVNVAANPVAENELKDLYHGEMKIPTVIVENRGTRLLTSPSESELHKALIETHVAPWIGEA